MGRMLAHERTAAAAAADAAVDVARSRAAVGGRPGRPRSWLVPCVACRSWRARWGSPPPRPLPPPRRVPAGPRRRRPAAASRTSSRSRRARPRGGRSGRWPRASRSRPPRSWRVARATFVLRIDGRADRVRARIELTRRGCVRAGRAAAPGGGADGQAARAPMDAARRPAPAATYDVALQAIDRHGRALHRTAEGHGPRPARGRRSRRRPRRRRPPAPSTASSRSRARGRSAGPTSRFGAGRAGPHPPGPGRHGRAGHAARRPRASSVYWIAFQKGGAGQYVVLRGTDGRDYVFMHLVGLGLRRQGPGASPPAGSSGLVGSTGSLERPAPPLRDLARRLVLVQGLRADRPAAELQACQAAG